MFTYFILMWFVVSVWSQGSCVSRSQKYYRKRTFPPKHTKLLKTRVWFPKANVDYYLFLQILHHVLHMQKYFCGKMELINWFQLEANAEQNTVSNCCWREKHLIFYYVFAVKNVMNARRKKKKNPTAMEIMNWVVITLTHSCAWCRSSLKTIPRRKRLRSFLLGENWEDSGKPPRILPQ